jgi:predicted Fe-Mo cluster-binding NifX family protein
MFIYEGVFMKIAVTYENGNIFQHFGKTQHVKLYDVTDKTVVSSTVSSTNGNGHSALAVFLKDNGIDTIICGGLGDCAREALAKAGITLYGGVSGDADSAVAALLAGTLQYNPQITCSHHDEKGHNCNH